MKCLAVLLVSLLGVYGQVNWQFNNNAGGPVWVGIQGNSGKPTLANGGFSLDVGQSQTITSDNDWAGRFWFRTWCDPNSQHCETGDCGNVLQCNGNGGTPPATLMEFTLKGDQGQDFYDISLVDGFNIGVTIQPVGGTGDCQTIGCTGDINGQCPDYAKVMEYNGNDVIGCKSDCLVSNSDQDCCRGAYGSAATCPPSNTAQIFKRNCPQAYSYAYDDATSTFTCSNTQTYILTVVQ